MEENIADALKIAGSVLLFVIGLSVAFLAFSQARESVDAIIKYSDREYFTIENDSRFYYLADSSGLGTNRYVGIETVIPTIYRAYKENFKIVFEVEDDDIDSDFYLFKKDILNPETGKYEEMNVKKIDLKEQSIGSDQDSRKFLNGILYRNYDDIGDYNNDSYSNKEDFEIKFKVKLDDSQGFYNYIKTRLDVKKYRIKEELGIYYDNDVGGTPEPQSVQDVNKVEKRVITYTFEK